MLTEFAVDDTRNSPQPDNLTIDGRCLTGTITAEVMWHRLIVRRWLSEIGDPHPIDVVDREVSVSLRIAAMSMWGRNVSEVPAGYNAWITLYGTGLEVLQNEVVLRKQAIEKAGHAPYMLILVGGSRLS